MLLCHGLDVDAVNKDGNTALHLASRHGTTKVAQRLAEAFPDEEIQNRRGFTALDEAIQAGRTRCTSCIRAFRERGKAHAMDSHCAAERLRLEKVRRNKVGMGNRFGLLVSSRGRREYGYQCSKASIDNVYLVRKTGV